MRCPKCRADMSVGASYCPECGAPVGKIREVAADWTCPRCQTDVAEDDPVCDSCGLKVGKLRDRLEIGTEGTPAGPDAETGDGSAPGPADPLSPADGTDPVAPDGPSGPDGGFDDSGGGFDDPGGASEPPPPPPGEDGPAPAGGGPAGPTDAPPPGGGPAGTADAPPPGPEQGGEPAPPGPEQGGEPAPPGPQQGDPVSPGPEQDDLPPPSDPVGGQPVEQSGRAVGQPEQSADPQGTQQATPRPAAPAGDPGDPQQGPPPGRAAEPQAERDAGVSTAAFFDGLPVAQAAGAGVLAYVLNLFITYGLATTELSGEAFEGSAMSTLDAAGWLFYGGHFVTIEGLDAFGAQDVNFLRLMYSEGMPFHDAGLPQEAFYLVPMVGLYLAGLVCVRYVASADDIEPLQAGKIGIPMAAGYGLLAVLGAITLFSVSTATGTAEGSTVQPSLPMAALLMGVVYPVVVGGIGGAIGSQ